MERFAKEMTRILLMLLCAQSARGMATDPGVWECAELTASFLCLRRASRQLFIGWRIRRLSLETKKIRERFISESRASLPSLA